MILSKQKADFMRVWDRIREVHDSGETIEGRIARRIKGGVVVDIMGVDAFLPGSQISLRQVPDFDALINQTMGVKIIKLNKTRRNIVVSRRVVLEEEREEMRSTLLNEDRGRPGADRVSSRTSPISVSSSISAVSTVCCISPICRGVGFVTPPRWSIWATRSMSRFSISTRRPRAFRSV